MPLRLVRIFVDVLCCSSINVVFQQLSFQLSSQCVVVVVLYLLYYYPKRCTFFRQNLSIYTGHYKCSRQIEKENAQVVPVPVVENFLTSPAGCTHFKIGTLHASHSIYSQDLDVDQIIEFSPHSLTLVASSLKVKIFEKSGFLGYGSASITLQSGDHKVSLTPRYPYCRAGSIKKWAATLEFLNRYV